MRYEECHVSDGSVIEIREVGGWKTNAFGNSVCNAGQLVLVGDRQHVEKTVEYYGLNCAFVEQ